MVDELVGIGVIRVIGSPRGWVQGKMLGVPERLRMKNSRIRSFDCDGDRGQLHSD